VSGRANLVSTGIELVIARMGV